MAKVMMVGTTEKSGGGVTTVIKLIKKMPVWEKYHIYWLGTQTQENKLWRLWYAIKAAFISPFLIWRYDIIHFHFVPGTCQITQLPQLICAKLYGKKIILEIHIGNQLKKHTKNNFFKWWLNQADQILLLAKHWEKLFHENYPEITTPVSVLYNACEMVSPIKREDKENLIIMAGWLNENKAPDILIKAWNQIKDKHRDWHITIMGNGEVERFKQMAINMNLGDSIDFPGYLTGEKKEIILHKSSIYCMCSYEEGFPMVVLESWARNTAVITTPVGGLPDVIKDNENCLIFPFGDSNALANCLEKLIENEDLRWFISENGRLTAQKNFSLESINNELEKIYKNILL